MNVKLIYEPSVYLVGSIRAEEDEGAELGRFLEDEGVASWDTDTDVDAEVLAEVAGRLCYHSYAKPRPGGNAAYIGHLKEVGHGSVLEHAVYSFVITGVSRSLTHELVRHRAGWSYSQRSQRYCDESEPAFMVPAVLAEFKRAYDCHTAIQSAFIDADENGDMSGRYADARKEAADLFGSVESTYRMSSTFESWLNSIEAIQSAYAKLADDLYGRLGHVADKTLRRKRAREAARSVLPNCVETQIYCTANARALRHFIELRASEHADAEIRAVAIKLWRALAAHSPNIFGDYVESTVNGVVTLDTPYRKV